MRMKNSTTSLDYWRSYFRTVDSDIFSIIDHAITVAASDCPKEFRLHRDAIAERLFSARLTHCVGCERVELVVPADPDRRGEEEGGNGGSKESKVNSSRDDQGGEMNAQQVSNCSFGEAEAEALTEEIEQESRYVDEVFRIKQVLLNWEDESDSVLFESLRRLQLLQLTVDLLKTTEIGKAVNPLRKHASMDIRQLSRTLINDWKQKVDEWVKATTAIEASEGTPDSVKPFAVAVEEEGLPSPPMDDVFFATQTGSMELSQFFDGMDDDGNSQQSREFKNRLNGRRTSLDAKRKPQAPNEENFIPKDSQNQRAIKDGANVRSNKPVIADTGPGRLPKSTMEKNGNMEPKPQQNIDRSVIPKRPQVGSPDKFKCSDDAEVQVKLEATKRKLQERYQQAENAKRQRTVQVMELHDLPKQGTGNRNQHVKPRNHNRQWANGRR